MAEPVVGDLDQAAREVADALLRLGRGERRRMCRACRTAVPAFALIGGRCPACVDQSALFELLPARTEAPVTVPEPSANGKPVAVTQNERN